MNLLYLSKAKKRQLFTILFALVISFAFFSKVFRLDIPKVFYFDEVYHAFTAKEYLHGNKSAYDIWAKPPQGVAYEWVHPPLAKLIMTGAMVIFGENSFGWRISSVIFGTGVLILTGVIAYQLFKSRVLSLFAMILLSLDGLVFVQSRIAMNDSHFICFALASIATFLHAKQKYTDKAVATYRTEMKTSDWSYTYQVSLNESWKWFLASGVFLGLSVSSKWTTFYVMGFMAFQLAYFLWKQKKLFSITHLLFFAFTYIAIPAILYLLSYAQFFSMGYSWTTFVELQRQIWWYHTNLKATHGYQSQTWQWLLDVRPVWMYVDYSVKDTIANIYNVANPFFLWTGLVAVVVAIIAWLKTKAFNLGFVLMAYFMMWVPWTFSPRIMFFYHYYPALPWLAMLLAWLGTKLFFAKKYPVLLVFFLLLASWFVVFYPNLSALPMPTEFKAIYFFFESWK